jgi:3-oxoacyl-[acyl-carrier-protein] synthase-1
MKLGVLASGMVTPLGFNARSSCAAIRVGFSAMAETRFKLDGAWLLGASIELPSMATGRAKDVQMTASAVSECLEKLPHGEKRDTALALCTAEEDRSGRAPWLDASFYHDVRANVEQKERLLSDGCIFAGGALGALDAFAWAQSLLERRTASYCVIVGVDSYLHTATVQTAHAAKRLLTEKNRYGYRPGEAAVAIAVTRAGSRSAPLEYLGSGLAREPSAHNPKQPLKADGLTAAYRDAMASAGRGFESIDYRLADITGEPKFFKEASMALSRTMRVRKEELPLWHPAECVGRVGAATVPLLMGVALAAVEHDYAPGPGVLCHASDDDGKRAAWILHATRS